MNTKSLKYKLKKQQSLVHKKQQSFDNRLSVVQRKRDYNALEDPHASYYFINKSVRNHLKKIKNAAINQTTHSLQKEKLKKLFNQKIKFKPKNFFGSINNPGVYQLEELLTMENLRKGSIKTAKSYRASKSPRKLSQRVKDNSTMHHNQSLDRNNFPTISQQLKPTVKYSLYSKQAIQIQDQNSQNPALKGIKLRQQNEQEQNLQNIPKKTRYDKLHQKKHKKFISFIQQKKKLVLQLKQSLQPRGRDQRQRQRNNVTVL